MRLEKGAIALALHNEPAFSEVFIAHLDTHAPCRVGLSDQLFNSSEKRLARALLLLANFGSDEASDHIIANVNQEMLAEMIGTTRSRVSFFMNKFRKLGLISYNGHIEVHRSLLNLVLHEQPHTPRVDVFLRLPRSEAKLMDTDPLPDRAEPDSSAFAARKVRMARSTMWKR